MRVTQDRKQLAACLTHYMAITESYDLARKAETLADRLETTSSQEAVIDAQLFLQQRGIECPEKTDA